MVRANCVSGGARLSAELQKTALRRFDQAVEAVPRNPRDRTAAKMRWHRDIMRATALKPSARVLAGVLLEYLGTRGKAWPGLQRLETDTGFSRSTVQRLLVDLVDAGWLLENRATGRGNSSAYTIDWKRFSQESASQATPFDEDGAEEEEKVSNEAEKGVKQGAERVSPVTPHTFNRIQERNPSAGASAREGGNGQGATPKDRANSEQPQQSKRRIGFQGVKADPTMPRGRHSERPKGKLSSEYNALRSKLEHFSNRGFWAGPGPAPGEPGCDAPRWLVEEIVGTPDEVARCRWKGRLLSFKKYGVMQYLDTMCLELGESAATELVHETLGDGWSIDRLAERKRVAA